MGWLDRAASRMTGPGAQHRPQVRAMTAAGAPVNLKRPALSHTRRETWQAEAYQYRESIPEMRFAGDFVANTLGRLRVFPAENRPRGEEPVPLETATRRQQDRNDIGLDEHTIECAVSAVERLNLNQHGSSLLARMAENLEYTGEAFLLGERGDEGESWSVRSISELQITQGGAHLVDPDSGMAMRELRDDEVDVMRLWNPHPRFYDRPDASVASLLDVLEGMFLLGRRGRAHDRSRISAGKGLFIPQEFLVFGANGAAISPDLVGAIDDPDQSPLLRRVIDYMETPVTNESDPSAIVPLIFTGPGQIEGVPGADMIKTFDIHGEDPKDIDARYEALVLRFARGISLSPERVKGLGDTNNWTAATVSMEEIKFSVEPRAERIVDALTAAYLHRMLRAMGVPAEQRAKVCLWFDASELTQNPNRGQDAKALFDAGELSGEALREANGFPETAEPSKEERLLRMLSRERLAPASIPAMIKVLQGQMPSISDITAVDQVTARIAERANAERPILEQPARSGPTARLPGATTNAPRGQGDGAGPPAPVGQRTQPATASQPGALGASAPLLAAAWNPALHPRDHKGRFISTGSKVKLPDGREGAVTDNEIGGGKVRVRLRDGHTEDVVGADVETTDRGPARPGMRHYDADRDRDEMAERGVKVPPGYSNVQVADDADSDLQWIGIDQKGREKREYSAAHKARQAAEKFDRVRALDRDVDRLDAALKQRSGDDDTVAALRLIREMGLRPGSDNDTRTEHKARGATNLLVGNVKVDGEEVTLDFIGKEGKHLVLPVDDPDLASMLRGRVAGRGGDERLFDTDETKVRAELKRHAPQSQVKDLRTYLATETAYKLVKSMPRPTTKREYQAARNQVGDIVSKRLGNTRVMALSSYINPAVFADWDAIFGVGGR